MTKSFKAFDLTGRMALITGAAGLLGVEHAGALLESGATVLLPDVDEAALVGAQAVLAKQGDPSRVRTRVMDVSQGPTVRAVAAELSDSGQRIDILINNASIDPKVTDLEGELEASRLEHFSLEHI